MLTPGAATTPGGGGIQQINITNPGHGFAVNDFTIISFTGGGSDNTATATVALGAGGGVTGFTVSNGGHGYTANTNITISGGGGSGATAVPNMLRARAPVVARGFLMASLFHSLFDLLLLAADELNKSFFGLLIAVTVALFFCEWGRLRDPGFHSTSIRPSRL